MQTEKRNTYCLSYFFLSKTGKKDFDFSAPPSFSTFGEALNFHSTNGMGKICLERVML